MSAIETVTRAAEAARAAAARFTEARQARDEAMQAAKRAGARPVEVERASGLHRSVVATILRGVPRGDGDGSAMLAQVEQLSQASRAAHEARAEAVDARDRAIAEAMDGEGVPAVQVIRATGLTGTAVHNGRRAGRELLAGQNP